jgi:hypothetical protein
VYNFTEATFYKLTLLWFVTVFAITEYRRPVASEAPAAHEEHRLAAMSP